MRGVAALERALLGFENNPRPHWQKEGALGARVPQTLRQVVAERSQEHIVDSVRRNGGGRQT